MRVADPQQRENCRRGFGLAYLVFCQRMTRRKKETPVINRSSRTLVLGLLAAALVMIPFGVMQAQPSGQNPIIVVPTPSPDGVTGTDPEPPPPPSLIHVAHGSVE